jgi:hypothetical protein
MHFKTIIETVNINPDRDAQYLVLQWMRWNEKLNAMPPNKAVNAAREWQKLIRQSLQIKVWNN